MPTNRVSPRNNSRVINLNEVKGEMEDSVQFQKKERIKEESKTDLPPWEQHATVVNMPRFDYQAPSALLQTSHSGFLITCPIKREKSATKEAIEILQRYFNLSTCASRDTLEFTDACQILERSKTEITNEVTTEEQDVDVVENADRKKRRMDANSEEFPSSTMLASNAIHGSVPEVHCPELGISSVDDPNLLPEPLENRGEKINCGDAHLTGPFTGTAVMPSLVKLARNGILFFSLPGNCFPNIVSVLVKIFQATKSGEMKSPVWCHRILPVQATCLLKEEDLHNIVVKLVKEHIGDTESKDDMPLKFAVGYNRRGVEGNEVGRGGSQKNPVVESSLLGRNECFQVVAGAVKEVATHSSVDLLSPMMAVLVEVLPLTGVRGSCVAAVSVLPGDLVNVKPRLCVKPLVLDVASNKKKQF